MCKEIWVIPVNRVVDKKRIIGKKWRAEEEERHRGIAVQTNADQTCSDGVADLPATFRMVGEAAPVGLIAGCRNDAIVRSHYLG
jgi:hypothetical protein